MTGFRWNMGDNIGSSTNKPVDVRSEFDLDYVTAFDRLRVSVPVSIGDFINKYEIDPEEYFTSSISGGVITYLTDQSSIKLQVTSSMSGACAVLESKDYFRYQPGKGLYWYISLFNDDLGYQGHKREWGFFSENNGLFFRLSGTYSTSSFQIIRRTSTSGVPVDHEVPQFSWSIDKMDGTGPSGKILNILSGNIYEVRRLQWLGVGNVAFYINGNPVHIMEHAGLFNVPYMKNAHLPLQWRVENVNTASLSSGSMRFQCANIGIDSGETPKYYTHSFVMTASVNVLNNSEKPLMSLRLKPFYPSGSAQKNKIILVPSQIHASVETARGALRLVWNASSLSGATWSLNPNQYSGAEIDMGATSLTGGITMLRPLLTVNEGVNIDISDFFGIDSRRLRRYNGESDTLTIMCAGEGVPSSDIRITLVWKEFR